ncbi:MAG: 16S rRNA (guanine(966)-N(2))-methyltransferase RsmD [Nitriliruptoraceae bacterium]|nr:16S rRNA (guanine(966)-N(2))-methyltransferase RsmD [Nitriliruptoraceae bacterium]
MRVIAGAAKGRRLTVPTGEHVRPTADRTKEALFGSLQSVVVGAHVLDLYAGSGGLGLEAASRGAASVTFVERDRRALEALRHNVELVDLPGCEIVARPVEAAIAHGFGARRFDLVLADPPYDLDEDAVAGLLASLVALLAPGAILVVERGSRSPAPRWPAHVEVHEPRRYGAATLHRATYAPPEAPNGTNGAS